MPRAAGDRRGKSGGRGGRKEKKDQLSFLPSFWKVAFLKRAGGEGRCVQRRRRRRRRQGCGNPFFRHNDLPPPKKEPSFPPHLRCGSAEGGRDRGFGKREIEGLPIPFGKCDFRSTSVRRRRRQGGERGNGSSLFRMGIQKSPLFPFESNEA